MSVLQVCGGGPNRDPLRPPSRIQTGSAGFELCNVCFEQLPGDVFQFILSLPSVFSSSLSPLQLKNWESQCCVQGLSLEYRMKEKEIWNRKKKKRPIISTKRVQIIFKVNKCKQLISLLTIKPCLGRWAGPFVLFRNENFSEKSHDRDTK